MGAFWDTQSQFVFSQVIDYQSLQKKTDGCGVENYTTKSYFSSSFRFHPASCHSLGRDVVSRATGSLSKILVPSEVHVDAALNKDNLLYFHKILQINKLHRRNQNWPVPGCAKNYPLIPKIRTLCVTEHEEPDVTYPSELRPQCLDLGVEWFRGGICEPGCGSRRSPVLLRTLNLKQHWNRV